MSGSDGANDRVDAGSGAGLDARAAKDLVRRGYDQNSHDYRADDFEGGLYPSWVGRFREYARAGGAVLDLGCGCGVPVDRMLVDAGFEVTGVDLSDVQIERARGLVPGATFLRADVTELERPAEAYDGIISLFALIHVPLDEQLPLLHRVSGWLRPGGCLLVTTGHTAWTGSEDDWHGAPMWWSHADAGTYRRWLDEVGLRVEEEEFVPEGDSGHTLFVVVRPTR